MYLRVLENEVRNARPNAVRRAEFEASHIEIRMFNTGHGEAVLLVFDNGRAWLIDSGCSNHPRRNGILGQRLINYLEQNSLTLETIIPSHPHIDHAGAFETILLSNSSSISNSLSIYRSDVSNWHSTSGWRKRFRDAINARINSGKIVNEIKLKNAHRELNISAGVTAHLFAGSGEGFYTSVFVQIRYHDARILFTGDAHCEYEIELLQAFGEQDFRADVLKVTHHGSSSGTATSVVNAIRPGIAIVSTGDDSGHRLEQDTLDRLGGHSGPPGPGARSIRSVFETVVDGDIILRTDGRPYIGVDSFTKWNLILLVDLQMILALKSNRLMMLTMSEQLALTRHVTRIILIFAYELR